MNTQVSAMPSNIVSLSPAVTMPRQERGAYKSKEAAAYLGICATQLWKLKSLGKIKCTSYGTYPKTELDRHLAQEMKEAEEAQCS